MIYVVNKRTKEHRKEIPSLRDGGPHQWDIIQATPDGWIEWPGGECPLPDMSKCYVRDDYAPEEDGNQYLAKDIVWGGASGTTITAYRPILDADTKLETPAWNGEGLPPVGCECEVNHLGEWHETTVVGYDGCLPVFKTNWHERYAYASGSDFKFRPIRSDEDRAVEDMAEAIEDCGAISMRQSTAMEVARAIYRAGYRKTAAADGEDV